MLVSVLIGITLVLCLGPIRTARLYDQAWRRQNAQIVVDNAAIILGRGDRMLFRFVAAANRLMDGLEISHHTAHACARVPGPQAPACRSTDVALEQLMQSVHTAAGQAARASWQSNRVAAVASASARGVPITLQRSAAVPLRSRTCRLCGLERAWDPTSEKPSGGILSAPHSANESVETHVVQTTSGWDYELKESF